ncbi:VCBS repeat-containing protein, partial [Candidatus Peregrinibacteria bacterium]|nr:VCBS repeat-containing protein [Candidatus Peregrinibacteria bacterium]
GVPMFSQFERRMFFGDLVHEEEQINTDSYKSYVKYLAALEDLAYMRYNKFWANALSSQNTAVLKDIPEEIKPKGKNGDFLAAVQNSNPLANMPDIFSKSVIDQSLIPYYQVLSKYIGSVNDWAAYTARYDKDVKGNMNVDSVVGLIGIKDEYTKYYLKNVNEALEKKINEVVGKIQEPLNLADYSEMSGTFGDQPFTIKAHDSLLGDLPIKTNKIFYKFNYRNEQDGKWYVNGIDASILQSPKQCMPLLGSTKDEYFDGNKNFNPLGVGGKYSILTRSIRSDDGATAANTRSVGVNTRMLSPISIGGQSSELFQATGGAFAGQAHSDGTYDTGAIVEDNPNYGISAFTHNPLAGKGAAYKGAVEQALQKGDVIVKVNGKNLNFSYSFDQAIEESYQTVKGVIDIVNDKNSGVKASEKLKNFPYPIKVVPADNKSVDGGDAKAVVGYFSIDFYRKNKPSKQYFSFTVNKDGLTTNSDPQGNPEAYVLLDTPPGVNFNSQGAIFTLYQNKNQGYNGGAYDASAGCNANSASKNGDRCLGVVAAMPVLDPAGSMGPVNQDGKLQFPEKSIVNQQNHVDSYQFPADYKYEDVDKVYLDSCYNGLPSVGSFVEDSNPFNFVLDPDTGVGNINHDLNPDLYGKLMKSLANFVAGGKAKQADYETNENTKDSSGYNPKQSTWAGLDKIDASDVILNSEPLITLKDFSDHYGLFDGKDNDGDGLTDYKWVDNDNDGVYETKYYDFKEADTKYGIAGGDMAQIARKLLSRDGTYTIPFGVNSFPYKKFDEDVTLTVKADNFKQLSSLILHNEPTDYTISQELKSQTTSGLPIDNPRYVAFQSEPMKGPTYPEPKPTKPNLDVQAILNALGDTKNPPIYPGQVQKINYVNLFDKQISNMAQLQAALITKANQLSVVPGAYRIFGPNAKAGDYSPKQISDEILNNYLLPVVKNSLDTPVEGFNLTKAAESKIYDALHWLTLNIDEKHQYVLQNYLNGDEKNQGNAYVADHTLLPSTGGAKAGFGYEAAYLVLNGDNDHFDMRFNKDLPEEKNAVFDPLAQVVAAQNGAGGNGGGGQGGNGAGGDGDGGDDNSVSEYVSVPLKDFLKELKKFLNSLTTVPKFTNECFNIASWEFGGKDKQPADKKVPAGAGNGGGVLENVPDQNANLVQLNSYVYSEIAGYDDLVKAIQAQKNNPQSGQSGQSVEGGQDVKAGQVGQENGKQSVSGGNKDNGAGEKGNDKNSGSNNGTAGKENNVSLEQINKNKNGAAKNGGGGANGNANGNLNSAGGSGGSGGSGSGNGSGGGSNGAGGNGSEGSANGSNGSGNATVNGNVVGGDQSNLQILKSTPVEDKKDKESVKDTKGVERGTSQPAKPVEPPKPPEQTQKWEDYFIGAKYYQKFLPSKPQSNSSRWLAEAFSDNPFTLAENNENSKYLVQSGDSMTADNASLMKIEAVIYDAKGAVETNKTHKVKFSLSSDLASFSGDNVVTSKDGLAVVYVKAGKVAGDVTIKEEVMSGNEVDKAYQVVTKDLHLVAGEPANIEIQSDANLLVANNQAKIILNFILKDKFGNVATNAFNKIAVFVNDKAKFDQNTDTDGQLIGTQLDTLDGKASIELFAGDKAGAADVVAVLFDPDLEDKLLEAGDDISGIDFSKYVGSTKTFQILDKVDLVLQTFDENFQAVSAIPADGKSIMRLGLKLIQKVGAGPNGQTVKGYNGEVKFTVLKPNLGGFVSKPPSNLLEGELNAANVAFKAAKVTGDEEILVEVPGFASESFKFKVKAGAAKKIELTSSDAAIDTNSNKQVTLNARLLDANGNLAGDDNGTVINFGATAATNDLVNFSQNKAVTKNGVAEVKVSGKNISGTANIIAHGNGLDDGTISLKINKHLASDEVKNFSPRALYVSLLGGAFGRVNEKNNLATSLLYSKGQVEALTTVTATQDENKRLFVVDGYGKIGFLTETVYGKVVPATNSFPYEKVVLSDDISGDELANVFVVPKINTPVLLLDDKTEIPDKEGIFVKVLDSANVPSFSQESDGIYFKVGNDTKVKVDKYGRIFLNDDTYQLAVPKKDDGFDTSNFAFVLSKGASNIALISFKQNFGQNVQTLVFGSQPQNFTPGIYVQPATDKNKYKFAAAFTGASTAEPQGLYMVDTEEEIDSSQAPGFGYSSLEGAKKDFGEGLKGSNKHMLLFAAGNSVGNSFIPYASDSGIIYGDPTIKLKVDGDLVSKDTGYSKDVGKAIYSGTEPIQQMIQFDFNGDGYDDLLLVYESGLIRLLENEISNERFRDRGYVLNMTKGIFSIAKIDVNNDGYDDLVIGTKEACNAGEQCISLITNDHGSLNRQTLNPALQNRKVYQMKAADMNNDGCEDLVTSDSSGSISIFYNKSDGKSCQGLNTNYGYSRNFGFNLNSDLNQVANLFINYPGMELPDDGKAEDSNWYKFIQFSLQTTEAPQNNPAAQDATDLQNFTSGSDKFATKDIPQQTFAKQVSFIHIKEDDKFSVSSGKQGKDLNGGSVEAGDIIEYLIALKNDSGNGVNNLMLSDVTPTSMTLNKESLKCLDAGCTDKLEWLDTGTSLRSGIIKNISVPSHGQRLISYQMTVNTVPKVNFELGNNFVKYPSDNNDSYLDIMVRPEVNPDGIITYLYSTGPQNYEKFEVTPADDSKKVVDDTFKKLGLPSPNDLLKAGNDAQANGKISPELAGSLGKFAAGQNKDSDYNGCSDNWNKILVGSENSGDAVANGIGNVLGSMRCSGSGCAPIPYNLAFLTPNTPVAGIPGIPVVNIWNTFPYFVPFSPSTLPSSVFRVYLSPTLTLGLGTAVCASPGGGGSLTGTCFAFAVPGGIPGACAAIKTSVNKAMTSAKSAVVNSAAGQAAVITDGQGVGGTKAVEKGGNWGDASDPLSAASKVNIKIPGFPSVVTNWMDGEIDEIYTKLLRFPTFYFILPDFSRVGKESKLAAQNFSFKGFHDFATSLSNFPFVKLEGKEIVIKIPAISPKEIAKYKYQAEAWVKHMKNELQKYKAWDCESNENRKTFCDKIVTDMTTLINSVKKTMDTLDQIANLPKDILQWRNVEAKYATQIICYLDAIMQYTGGYIKRQQKIVESWIKAIQDTIKTFKQWKIILDTVAEYQQSCDKCKNDRFSKLGLIMQLFAVVPDIPIVPLPKWPDVVVDFSQIKTGVKIMWPDVIFRPEPILLPNLPDITLPDVLPLDFKIDLNSPKFNFQLNVPNLEKFTLPNLPDLPQVPLPQLPDLPKPPKIPALPNFVGKFMTNVKFIFKILCLLKNGFLPVPENTLGTEIETLTQPSVQSVLPIIKNLGMQWPAIEYSYVDQIRITGKLNFTIDTNFVYVLADIGAQKWNENITRFVGAINKISSFPYGQALSKYIQDEINKAYQPEQDKKSSALPLSFDMSGLKNFQKEINDYVAQMEKEKVPDTYHLVATENFLNSSNPLLNRSLAEVENNIKYEDLSDTPGLQQMAAIRNQMIAYAKNLNSSNEVLKKIDDYNDFGKILVESGSRVDLIAANPSVSDVGSGNISDTVSGKTLQFSFLGKEAESAIKQVAENANLKGKRNLIASAINFSAQDLTDNANAPTPPPIGFFVGAGDVNESVLSYTAELKGKTNILFSDVDHDKDYDIVYSTGGDVYLKNNYKFNPSLPKGNLIVGLTNSAVSDYVNGGGTAVDGIKVPYVSTGKVDISWSPIEGAASYKVILRKSIYDDYDKAVYTFEVNVGDLNDPTAPRISEKIPNGNYYVNVFAINAAGKESLPSDTTIAAPQSCADSDPPTPVINSTDYTLSIFKNLEIDASGSFDADGEIQGYYLETLPYEKGKLKTTQLPKTLWSDVNVLLDEDGDGITFDDKSNPKFNIGPFVNEGDIGDHKFLLHVVDGSGKDASLQITVHVIVPSINLDQSFATSGVASGTTIPKTAQLPFWLMRNRYIERVVQSKLKLVPKIDKVRDAKTEDNGSYNLQDFNLEDMILVQNADGKIIAEINPNTGDVGKVEAGYKTIVNQAMPPNIPTSVSIVDKNNQILGTIYLVADANDDVKLYQNFGFNAENTKNLNGVNADDPDAKDNFVFENLPVTDPENPGGAVLKNVSENKVLVSIDSTGNIVVLDKRITLTRKENNHEKDPLIIQINFEGKAVGEVYISILKSALLLGPNDVPFMTPRKPSAGVLSGSVAQSKVPDFANMIIDPNFKFSAQDLVKRKDFVKVLLKMICIVPRPEAYQPFNSGSGYADNKILGDYHPDIKEATLLGFVDGYKGEPDAQGLFPFKPESNITRAEATKIILEALQYRGVVDISSIKESTPWYGNYMQVAQNLTPYLKTGKPLKNNFIVTSEEAKDPNKLMSFGELLDMVQRVLDIYNCFKEDTNKNGLSDYCEAKYKISDPQADEDKDGLNNAQECAANLNPLDQDTDHGGVTDGKELAARTNPLDPSDDAVDDDHDGLSSYDEVNIYHTDPHNPDTDGGGKTDGKDVADCNNPLNPKDDKDANSCKNQSVPGLYIVPAECNTCPCISTFLHKAELIPGDIFFPAIGTYDQTYIFTKGNEVQIQSITK